MNAYELAAQLSFASINTEKIDDSLITLISLQLTKQADEIADLKTTISFLEEECKALRGQVNETA